MLNGLLDIHSSQSTGYSCRWTLFFTKGIVLCSIWSFPVFLVCQWYLAGLKKLETSICGFGLITVSPFDFFQCFPCLYLEILMKQVVSSLGLSVTFGYLGPQPPFHADLIPMFWSWLCSPLAFLIFRECPSHYKEPDDSDIFVVVVKIVHSPLRQMVEYHITSDKVIRADK